MASSNKQLLLLLQELIIMIVRKLVRCYIIAEGFFLYYHFSLVISYLSV